MCRGCVRGIFPGQVVLFTYHGQPELGGVIRVMRDGNIVQGVIGADINAMGDQDVDNLKRITLNVRGLSIYSGGFQMIHTLSLDQCQFIDSDLVNFAAEHAIPTWISQEEYDKSAREWQEKLLTDDPVGT